MMELQFRTQGIVSDGEGELGGGPQRAEGILGGSYRIRG